jgi:opacity protein-like surface antigen
MLHVQTEAAGPRDECLFNEGHVQMNIQMKAGLATAALAVAVFAQPASAADLFGHGKRGSIKDAPGHHYAAPTRGPVGPCYFRGDVGYSVSKDPDVKWPITSFTRTYLGADRQSGFTDSNYVYQGDDVTGVDMENRWFGGIGLGCGMGSYGLRGEVMLYRSGSANVFGRPGNFTITEVFATPTPPTTPGPDPLHTSLKSTTAMVNVYKDLGRWGGVTPYIGGGVGVAYNTMSEVYFTENVFLTNRIQGDSRASLAWSLMAGIGWQISDRAILDFGYRYMDYGKAESGRVDSGGFLNPSVRIDDLAAHEFKIGLRYHFGSGCCDAPAQVPMK